MKSRAIPLLTLLWLAACSAGGPQLGLGVGIGPNGVSVTPTVTGNVNGVSVGASPDGASIGTAIGNVNVGASY